jgi:hypothetical protein
MAPAMKQRIIIYTPAFDDKVGGIMALYGLGHALRKNGVPVSIWQWNVKPNRVLWLAWRIRSWIARAVGRSDVAFEGEMQTWAESPLALATPWEIEDAIVLYPEIIDGNPLNAKRVVRWLLNKPGFFTGKVNYGPGELYFYYDKAFDDPSINPFPDNRLTILTMKAMYRQTNFGPRQGTCYVLRKGKGRAPDPATLDGPVIDDLPHEEVVALFNRCEFCVSYDARTMYSFYAALCGCKSIVIPEPGISKEQWDPDGNSANGVAYGFDDLPCAERGRPLLASALERMEQNNLRSAERFREKCEEFFSTRNHS